MTNEQPAWANEKPLPKVECDHKGGNNYHCQECKPAADVSLCYMDSCQLSGPHRISEVCPTLQGDRAYHAGQRAMLERLRRMADESGYSTAGIAFTLRRAADELEMKVSE